MGVHRSHKQAEKGKESPSLCFIAPRYEYESFFIIQDVGILRHFFRSMFAVLNRLPVFEPWQV